MLEYDEMHGTFFMAHRVYSSVCTLHSVDDDALSGLKTSLAND